MCCCVAAQLETFHNSCMRRMMGRYWGTRGPSTAELLDATGQMPISQLLSRHRVRWLGHAARKPDTTIVNQLLHADSIPGRPRPVGRPHYTWMDGAMQDLNTLGPRLHTAGPPPRLAEAGAGPGAVEGGCQPVLALSVLIDSSLLSFSFSL